MSRTLRVVSSLLTATLAGCVVGPEYITAHPDSAGEFLGAEADQLSSGEVSREWWRALEDPDLLLLIDQALSANNNIEVARASLRQSRAILAETARVRFPLGTASASSVRQRQGNPTDPVTIDADSFAIDAAWEIDLYGRLRNATRAARARYQAAEANLQDTQVSIAAEVGLAFVQMRGTQQRLEVAQSNALNQERTLALTKTLLDGGRGTDLDVARAQAQLEQTQALIPALHAQVQAQVFRLGSLTNRTPYEISPIVNPAGGLPELPDQVGLGVPGDLLRRRPDVRAAEREMAAATFDVGVVTADLYPRVDLLASFGRLSVSVDDLGDSTFSPYSSGAALSWPLLDLRRVRARIAAADARAHAAVNRFEQTWLIALAECETAIVALRTEISRRNSLMGASEANRRAAELAKARYGAGVDNFLQVLDAERRVLESQDQLAASETAVLTSLIRLYKALGGGWTGELL